MARWVGVRVLLAALVPMGCGAADAGDADGGGPTTLHSYTFTVKEFAGPLSPGSMVLADVELCEAGLATNCETTTAAGTATIVLPGRSESAVVFRHDGHVRTLFPVYAVADRRVDVEIPPDAITSAFAAALGIEWPAPERGVMAIRAAGAPPGSSVMLDPTSGEGPFYTADNTLPDPTRTTFSSSGLALATGLSPGTYEVGVEGCSRENGWAAARGGALRAPIEADSVTIVLLSCP